MAADDGPDDGTGDGDGNPMSWRLDDPEDEAQEASPQPWRAGAPLVPAATVQHVVVDKWDDELPVPTAADELRDAAKRARRGFGPTARHAVNLVIFAAAVIGALAGIAVAWMHVVNDPLADAHAYYEAASRLNDGKPLYPVGMDPNGNHIYLYPPLLAVLLRPLALLPFEAFALIWELVVIATFVALVRHLGVRKRSTWLAIGLLGVPIGWSLTIAQAHVPMTLLLALGQPWSIALAANLKLTPVLIAIWWLGRRNWEAFFAFLIWIVLFALVQVLIDFENTVAYFQNVGLDQIGAVRNISPYAQSEVLWIALVLAGALLALALARTRWGWPAAVALATFSPPRLLVYMLTGLLAAVREPRLAGERDPDDLSDPAEAYRRATQ